jgi:hypothetical protein
MPMLRTQKCGRSAHTAGIRWNIQAAPKISFAAEAGQTYYLVVDGFDGAAGSYTLKIDCS